MRYKQHCDDYLKEHNHLDIRALVAFTAFKDKETGLDYTEAEINGFGERELPDKFAGEEYNLLLKNKKY
ncbi:MAG: hypothetical protein GY803_11565, partial [Chloroflexi bacterium]|nr:hypothetical protein [Chloroflexota bacterium]